MLIRRSRESLIFKCCVVWLRQTAACSWVNFCCEKSQEVLPHGAKMVHEKGCIKCLPTDVNRHPSLHLMNIDFKDKEERLSMEVPTRAHRFTSLNTSIGRLLDGIFF
ncbi:hypothetical protein ACROYT_G042973 [Oculina patagonica]